MTVCDLLRALSKALGSLLRLIMGDFNDILKSSNTLGGEIGKYAYMNDFGQCLHEVELVRVPYS